MGDCVAGACDAAEAAGLLIVGVDAGTLLAGLEIGACSFKVFPQCGH